jgi:sulfur-carrier protein
MIRVELPAQLQTLAQVRGEVEIQIDGIVTPRSIIDALEFRYPMLRGTIRDCLTQERRPYLRFFACAEDMSREPVDTPVPDAVAKGREPFLVIGAMSGG